MLTWYDEIHNKEDYDLYIDELIKSILSGLPTVFKKCFERLHSFKTLHTYLFFAHLIKEYDIFHHHFSGGFLLNRYKYFNRERFLEILPNRLFSKYEAQILHYAKKKIVITSYGGDVYMLSKIIDPSVRHVLQIHYPKTARCEENISKNVAYWVKHADAILTGYAFDGVGRMDIPVFNHLVIDQKQWSLKKSYSSNNGYDGVVKILHSPNHRWIKGTEFLLQAIEDLESEGLKIEIILLEKTPNDQVRQLMRDEADIMYEQMFAGHGLNAIEAMSTGLPVMSKLDHESYTRVFRNFSFLNECPILSITHNTIKENLRILITNPDLREVLGRAGRQYVEKYHSYEFAQYMFGAIYDKIWNDKNTDIINLFHPILSEYNKSRPYVNHPLEENKLPSSYYRENAN